LKKLSKAEIIIVLLSKIVLLILVAEIIYFAYISFTGEILYRDILACAAVAILTYGSIIKLMTGKRIILGSSGKEAYPKPKTSSMTVLDMKLVPLFAQGLFAAAVALTILGPQPNQSGDIVLTGPFMDYISTPQGGWLMLAISFIPFMIAVALIGLFISRAKKK
jgi:hypothetical protein